MTHLIPNDRTDQFKKLLVSALAQAKSIALTTHINPDGDGICACAALKYIFRSLGYAADIVADDLALGQFSFLHLENEVQAYREDMQYDLLIIVDVHDQGRLGKRAALADKAQCVMIIDHHEVEDDLLNCEEAWIDSSAVCTGWMVYHLFRQEISALPHPDSLYVGNCLYTTLLNDTNNFTNGNTDAHAFEMSAFLMSLGIRPAELYRIFMAEKTPQRLRFIGQVLSTIDLYDNDKVLFMHSTLAMLAENGLDAEATSHLTREVQNARGVETIVYFREEAQDTYRLSLRSRVWNVHGIAMKYGGGGHKSASGCTVKGSLDAVKQEIHNQLQGAEKLHG